MAERRYRVQTYGAAPGNIPEKCAQAQGTETTDPTPHYQLGEENVCHCLFIPLDEG